MAIDLHAQHPVPGDTSIASWPPGSLVEFVTWQRYWEIADQACAGRRPAIVALPSVTLSGRFGPDASWLMENFRFSNVADCRAAADRWPPAAGLVPNGPGHCPASPRAGPPRPDTSVPHSVRVYDYLLGGRFL